MQIQAKSIDELRKDFPNLCIGVLADEFDDITQEPLTGVVVYAATTLEEVEQMDMMYGEDDSLVYFYDVQQ